MTLVGGIEENSRRNQLSFSSFISHLLKILRRLIGSRRGEGRLHRGHREQYEGRSGSIKVWAFQGVVTSFQPEARSPGEDMQGPRWVRSELEQDGAREGKEGRRGDAQEAEGVALRQDPGRGAVLGRC